MSNLRISRANLWDSNTLSYSSQASSYVVTNTQQRWVGRTWRTQNSYLASQWLKSYNAARPAWQALVILGHNFTAGATIKVQASDDNFATTPEDITLPVTAGIIVYFHTAPVSRYYTRILMDDVSNPDNYLEIGRVFMGLYLEPRWGFDPSREEGQEDPSVIGESEHGQATAILRTGYSEISYNFNAVTVADQVEFRAHFAEFGKAKPFLIFEHPTLPDPYLRTLYVRAIDWQWRPCAGTIKALQLGVQTER